MSYFQMNGCLMSHLCPAHWTCSFSVEPCRDAFFTEDVFAVKHGRFLEAVVTNRTHATSVGFQVLVAWTRTITLKNESTFDKNVLLGGTYPYLANAMQCNKNKWPGSQRFFESRTL